VKRDKADQWFLSRLIFLSQDFSALNPCKDDVIKVFLQDFFVFFENLICCFKEFGFSHFIILILSFEFGLF